MARLSEAQWQEVKAAYEVRYLSNRELAAKFGVGESAIRKRAGLEGWIKGESAHLVDKNINIIKDIKLLGAQSAQLSAQHQAAISDEVQFRLDSDKDMMAIQAKANALLNAIDSPAAAAQLMALTVKHREARLGKQPEVAVNVVNTQIIGFRVEVSE